MKICVTTSNSYLHLIPVFTYLFNKYFGSEYKVEIVGYEFPKCELPSNFEFHSMGVQGHVSEWSTDLRKYFEAIPDQWFIYLMEDTFIKEPVKHWRLNQLQAYCYPEVGRIDLTNDLTKRKHSPANYRNSLKNEIFKADKKTNYRQSTQPSLWNKDFLLKYLTPGLSPWDFEKQDTDDDYLILGGHVKAVVANEGVRKHNPHLLDLNGFSEEDVKHIKTLL
jgi:hypothetical protein